MTLHPWTVELRHETHVAVDLPSALLYLACAVVVALLTRHRPALGVAALLVLAPFDVARYVGPTTVTTLKAGVVGMLAALAFSRPALAAFRTVPVRAMLLAFAATFAAIALSATRAEHLGAVVREAFKSAEYAGFFIAAIAAYATDPDDRPFWSALQIVLVLVCCSAVAEYLLGAHSGIFLRGQTIVFPRIAGALEGPNQLAGYLDIALPVLVARALVHRDRSLLWVIAFASVTDVLTVSRSGIVSAALGIVVVMLVLRPFRRTAWRFAAAATLFVTILIGVALLAGVPARYFSIDQETQSADHLANRHRLWDAALALWRRSPLVGVGAGNYELDLPEVGLTGIRTHANSIYLQSLAEGGVIGLAATLVLFGVTVVTLAGSRVRRPLVVGALGATVALASHQVFDDLFFFPKVASAYWLVVGVAVAEIAARRLFERRRTAQYVEALLPAR